MTVEEFRSHSDDDYLRWVADHRHGYVLNIEPTGNPRDARPHLAYCETITGTPGQSQTSRCCKRGSGRCPGVRCPPASPPARPGMGASRNTPEPCRPLAGSGQAAKGLLVAYFRYGDCRPEPHRAGTNRCANQLAGLQPDTRTGTLAGVYWSNNGKRSVRQRALVRSGTGRGGDRTRRQHSVRGAAETAPRTLLFRGSALSGAGARCRRRSRPLRGGRCR
jgi:hypothetical protein